LFTKLLNFNKKQVSLGLLKRFKQRHGIRELQIQGEKLSADYVEATLFIEELEQIIEEKSLVAAQIYNIDKTDLNWRAIPTRTLVYAQEQNAPGCKLSKDGITVMCCANTSREDNLKLAVVRKSKSPRSLTNVTSHLVDYYNYRPAWITRVVDKYICSQCQKNFDFTKTSPKSNSASRQCSITSSCRRFNCRKR
jgi:hypothetical protein